MAFWTSTDVTPLMKFQFRVTIGEVLWYAKAVQLPSYEVTNESYQLVNQKFKYPGLLVWNDISITLVEVGKSAILLKSFLTSAGYKCPGDCTNLDGLSKSKFSNKRPIIIEQLHPNGKGFQYWKIKNWMLTAAKFGDMSYDADEMLSVEMNIAYDCAELHTGSVMGGKDDAKPEQKKKNKLDAEAREKAAAKRLNSPTKGTTSAQNVPTANIGAVADKVT